MGIDDQVVVNLALKSLPKQFDNLHTTYITQKDKWSLNELIVVLVQEDERIRKSNTATVNLVNQPQWKSGKGKGKASTSTASTSKNPKKAVNMKKSFKCFFCKKEGHMKKNCDAYKKWAAKKGVHKEQAAKEK